MISRLAPFLRRQKLKKRKRRHPAWIAAPLAFLAVGWMVYQFRQWLQIRPSAAVRIELVTSSLPQPEILKEKVRVWMRSELRSQQNLGILLDRLIRKFHPEDAQLIVLSPDEIFVHLKLRDPALVLNGKTWRFVSTKGQVFGDASKAKDRLRLLSGIDAGTQTDRSGRLLLTPSEQEIIAKALQLDRLLDEYSLNYRHMKWIAHRGFQLQSQGDLPEIMIGESKLEERIKKSKSLLTDYQKNRKFLSRMEVDFDNKMFVKERMPL